MWMVLFFFFISFCPAPPGVKKKIVQVKIRLRMKYISKNLESFDQNVVVTLVSFSYSFRVLL